MLKKLDFKACTISLSTQKKVQLAFGSLAASAFALILLMDYRLAYASSSIEEPVKACVLQSSPFLSSSLREQYAQCLGWQSNASDEICQGSYNDIAIPEVPEGQVRIEANAVSFYAKGRSKLEGNVNVQESKRQVSAQTAYIYRDARTNKVTRVELLGNVRYKEPGRLMVAQKATINPLDNSGRVDNVLYRLDTRRISSRLPAWGRAKYVERYPNQDYFLKLASYSTCAPKDKAWEIQAKEISINHAKSTGTARNATLRLYDWPVLYTPYLSFPTTKARKSGFLLPVYGYSNVGGFDLGLPYYWNIAPNYDAKIIPHIYSRRGVMMGGEFRYLSRHSQGRFEGHILPKDRAFKRFVNDNQAQFPSLRGQSSNRWAVSLKDSSFLSPGLHFGLNFQEVSDDYYLQDFSTNLAVSTQNQLLRRSDLTLSTEHWTMRGLAQSYQTLHPINQSVISNIYQRLPQLSAKGTYYDLPFGTNLDLLGQIDNFRWPAQDPNHPQGPRAHLSPILSLLKYTPWGYLNPTVQLVENNYRVSYRQSSYQRSFNRLIPRYSLDTGLIFERFSSLFGQPYRQTLEPRMYYLYVPYHDQSSIPVYDSAYMIFNMEQLFRTNRFSGFDRIGDANQLAYAVTTRWLSEKTGKERASLSIGQLRYFSDRRVFLCYSATGICQQNPLTLGFLSPTAKYSPVASRLTFQLSPEWRFTGDYIWDGYTSSTNNAYANFQYQPVENHIINFGYSYLTNGDVTQVANSGVKDSSLNQATFAYAWPFNERWSSLGIYSYNISKRYGMMSALGIQYDSCCWAVRLMGGRTFKSLSPSTLAPQYNNNVFLQVLLKGLGSAASSNPTSILNAYLPSYQDVFRR